MPAAKIAAAYLRRSTATTNNPGNDSREAQEAAVQRLCGQSVVVYEDWGTSGSGAKISKRTGYARLKDDIADGRVSSVCAYSLSRLGRNARELLGFMELCREHGVTVRTATENIDTGSAFGRAMFGLLAVFAELELEQGKERSAAARAARYDRHAAAGALLPGDRLPGGPAPLYGYQYVQDGRVTRRVHDPERPIDPLIKAWREAGSGRGGVALLNAPKGEEVYSGKDGHLIGTGLGIPSPSGTASWSSGSIIRILRAHAGCDPSEHEHVELPDRSASGRALRASKVPSLFRGLLRCHCNHLMTPNTVLRSYYCSNGRNGAEGHGKYNVQEKALKAMLASEVAKVYSPAYPVYAERQEQAIRDLEARRERVVLARMDGLISQQRANAETADIDAKLEKLTRQQTALVGVDRDAAIDLDSPDVEATNAALRRLWVRVDLEPGYKAAHVVWVVDQDELRAADEKIVAEFMGMTAEQVAALDPSSVDEFQLVAKGGEAEHREVQRGSTPASGPGKQRGHSGE